MKLRKGKLFSYVDTKIEAIRRKNQLKRMGRLGKIKREYGGYAIIAGKRIKKNR